MIRAKLRWIQVLREYPLQSLINLVRWLLQVGDLFVTVRMVVPPVIKRNKYAYTLKDDLSTVYLKNR